MPNLPNALQSPRIEDGIIKWYDGDTFSLVLSLSLYDQDGEPITIGAEDTVDVVFYTDAKKTVHTFTFTGATDNRVTLNFDGNATADFPAGEYFYDVFWTGSLRKTLVDGNPVVVE